MSGWQRAIKRGVDIVGAGLGLLLLSPLFAVVALIIKLESPGPVFFRHPRVGKDGKDFVPLKFRTMVKGAIGQGKGTTLGEGDARVTRFGALLRAWAIDELPQLWNVLKGEMSLIGPRPTFRHQVEAYTEFQRRRLEVRPGITGLAQVNGRNNLDWPERIELDVQYVERATLRMDLGILLKTFWVAFVTREGVYAEGGVNPDFGRESNEGEGTE